MIYAFLQKTTITTTLPIMMLSIELLRRIKSTQCKKLATNALWFTYQYSKACKPHEKKHKKKHLMMKNWKLWVWCSLLNFFIWFPRFQRSIFQTFWKGNSCTDSLFLELDTSDFGCLLFVIQSCRNFA